MAAPRLPSVRFSALGGLLLMLIFIPAAMMLTYRGLAPAPEADRTADRIRDFQNRQAEDRRRLEEYGVMDAAKGSYRIPIENAMELTRTELNRQRPHVASPPALSTPSPTP